MSNLPPEGFHIPPRPVFPPRPESNPTKQPQNPFLNQPVQGEPVYQPQPVQPVTPVQAAQQAPIFTPEPNFGSSIPQNPYNATPAPQQYQQPQPEGYPQPAPAAFGQPIPSEQGIPFVLEGQQPNYSFGGNNVFNPPVNEPQPQYQQPQYVAPATPQSFPEQPQYQQPQYPQQAAYAQPQFAGYDGGGQLPPKPKRSKLFYGLVAGGAVIVVLIAAGFIGLANTLSHKNSPVANDTSSSSPSTGGTTSTDNTISLDKNVSADGGIGNALVWIFPVLSTDGWSKANTSTTGLVGYNNSVTGCQVTATQNKSDKTTNDKADSVAYQQDFVDELTTAGATNVSSSVEPSISVPLDGKLVELYTTKINYTGKDGKDYVTTFMDRNFSNVPSSVALLYSCGKDSYNSSGLTSILKQTSFSKNS